MADSDLRAKYGPIEYDAVRRVQAQGFEQRLARLNRLDPHFARLWLDFTANMTQRPALDGRTRFLVLVGQFTMTRSHDLLADTIRAALTAGIKAREVLEIILQCVCYGGYATIEPAVKTFHAIAEELNLLEELEASQLPLDGNDSARSYEEESKTWKPEDLADPRCADLMERHGWRAVGRGLTMRPGHHLKVLAWHDAMDAEWAGLWVKFGYGGMYARGIVDDKTRLLCMVGDCVAVGEATEGRAHMRGALRAGATPHEVFEVIIQSKLNFGAPPTMKALKVFVEIMAEEGRLDEIGNPPSRE